MKRRLYSLWAVAWSLLWLFACANAARAADASLEYPIKATFLQKFGDFVTWPPVAFEAATGFSVCVLGEDPFGAVLDRALVGHALDGRAMTVRRIAGSGESAGCQILYIGRINGVEAVLAALRGLPLLTVTDEQNGQAKGIIHFMLRDNRVRFAIDDQAAAVNGLGISSKLLSIAVSVNPRSRAAP
jgi:hypothetical protein